jgi:ElaB/YqjD/DUF883 family membrane-anchored ribosome-binding protein
MRNLFAALMVLLFVTSTFAPAKGQINGVEIRVEIKGGIAEVEAEVNETEMKFTLNTTNKDVIIEEIAAKTGLSLEIVKNATKFEEEPELEIEVKFVNSAAKVKVVINETEMKFTLNTTNKDVIIEEIAAKTGLSLEIVKNATKFEEEFKKKIRKINFPVKKRTIVYQLKKHLIGMDAVIEFAGELGKNTTELEELRNEFNTVIENIEGVLSSDEKDPLGRHVAAARRIANEFRKKSKELLGDEVDEARERVRKAIAEDREGILAREADKIRAEEYSHGLNSFDAHVRNAQKKINRLIKAGLNVSEAEEKLEEIRDKRPALVEAIEAYVNSCRGKPLTCDNEEHRELRELRREIRGEFKELDGIIKKIRQGERIAHLAAKLERAIDRAENKLAKAEEKGLDVTVYRVKLEEIRKILGSARSKAEAGDVKGAMLDIRSGHVALTNVLKELAKERREFLKELKEKKKAKKAAEKNKSRGSAGRGGKGK